MARLLSSGFELQSLTNGVEWDTKTGSPTINTTTKRSGSAALRCNPAAAAWHMQSDYANSTTKKFIRVYVFVATAPSVLTDIIANGDSANSYTARIRLATDRTLELWSDTVKLGSSSAALSLNTWYRVELTYDDSDVNNTAVGFLDGVQFATGNGGDNGGNGRLRVGIITATTADVYFDDIAVNDSSGTSQTGLPGAGAIIHLQPGTAGDNTQWTPLSSTNVSQVSEVTPDDVTTFVSDNTTGHIDDYNLVDTPAAIGASDTINVVCVGVRYAGVFTSTNATIVVRCKAVSAGTVSESAAFSPNAVSYKTNTNAVPITYPLILYTKPGGAVAWSKTDLDASQIGLRTTASSTNATRVSTVWMLIDSTPSAGGATPVTATGYMTANTGFWGM